MESFFETEGRGAVVCDDQFKPELLTECGTEEQMIIAEPGFLDGIVGGGGEGDGNVVVGVGDTFQLPGFCAHQAVRRGMRITSARVENHGKQTGAPPRIAEPSCHFDFELTVKDFFGASGFPRSDVRSVKIISPEARGAVTCTQGSPPRPSTILAMPEISKRRFKSLSGAGVAMGKPPWGTGRGPCESRCPKVAQIQSVFA